MKKNFKFYKREFHINKELRIHYEELFRVAVSELKFERLKNECLKAGFEEVAVLLDKDVSSKIIKDVVAHRKKREMLDTLIHYHLIGK